MNHAWIVETDGKKDKPIVAQKCIQLTDDEMGDPIPLNGRPQEQPENHLENTNIDTKQDNSEEELLFFKKSEVRALINSIKSKPFIILAGISGTGKTQLARTVAHKWVTDGEPINPVNPWEWIVDGDYYTLDKLSNYSTDQVSFTPVRPDWTDNKKIWGYLNPLEEIEVDGSKKKSFYATDILRLVIRAEQYPDKDYFIILDEMNLARVEYYFSDILSLMESPGETVSLHSEENVVDAKSQVIIPSEINFPSNIKIIGTVNVDETTHSFAPKVLDRAFVLEFLDADYELLFQGESDDITLNFCNDLKEILKPVNLHFGYRTVREIKKYIKKSGSEPTDTFDFLLKSKVLPKLHGTISDLEIPLKHLLTFCKPDDNNKSIYPESFKKIESMLQRLEDSGFTSFF